MWLEAWIFSEDKSKKNTQKEVLNSEQEKILDFQKRKEKLRQQIETNNELTRLRDLLESWDLSIEDFYIIEDIVNHIEIDEFAVSKIFEKIDEIGNNPKIDLYLPLKLRITKEEYLQALKDTQKRDDLLKKIDKVLWVLAQHISSANWDRLGIFSSFLWLLDRNLVIIQENTIDIKNSLQK